MDELPAIHRRLLLRFGYVLWKPDMLLTNDYAYEICSSRVALHTVLHWLWFSPKFAKKDKSLVLSTGLTNLRLSFYGRWLNLELKQVTGGVRNIQHYAHWYVWWKGELGNIQRGVGTKQSLTGPQWIKWVPHRPAPLWARSSDQKLPIGFSISSSTSHWRTTDHDGLLMTLRWRKKKTIIYVISST